MTYKLKGGKLRKHRGRDREWTRLSDDAFPAAFISRPPCRTLDALRFLPGFTAQVAKGAQGDRSSLCFNEDHDYEFHAVPEVFAVARMSDDAPPMVMGICPDCAKLSDAELYSIMRRQFALRGIGKTADDADLARVVMEVENVAFIEAIPGVQIGIALPDRNMDPNDCGPVSALIEMLRRDALPYFMAFRRGVHNCHVIVGQLYLDFKELGIDTAFAYKAGRVRSSRVAKTRKACIVGSRLTDGRLTHPARRRETRSWCNGSRTFISG